MTRFYCHQCAQLLGLISPSQPITFTGSAYQLGKFIKHTSPTGTYPINGIFDDPSYENYANYLVTTLVSGSVSMFDDGRINIFWVAGRRVGALIEENRPVVDADSVIVVFHDNDYHIHGFPADSSRLGITVCANCGIPIITGS